MCCAGKQGRGARSGGTLATAGRPGAAPFPLLLVLKSAAACTTAQAPAQPAMLQRCWSPLTGVWPQMGLVLAVALFLSRGWLPHLFSGDPRVHALAQSTLVLIAGSMVRTEQHLTLQL